MPIPERLRAELAELRAPVEEASRSIEALIDREYSANWDNQPVGIALTAVEESVENWARVSFDTERDLLDHLDELPSDADAVQARVGGIAMLHLAIAADVATILPFDDAPRGATVSEVHQSAQALGQSLFGRAETIRDAALGPDALIESMSMEDDPRDDAEAERELGAGDNPNITLSAVVVADFEALVGDEIDEVVNDILERASRASTAILLGLAGGGGHRLLELIPHLRASLSAAPTDVRQFVARTVRRISRLVNVLIARARKALNAVLGGYKASVENLLDAADPTSWVAESLAGNLLSRLVSSADVRRRARLQLSQAPDRQRRVTRVKVLKKTHKKWVGPVRVVARGLPALWGVTLGPLPIAAAPVAAVALLGWTIMITGDQLDASRFPDLWKGVVRRASGE